MTQNVEILRLKHFSSYAKRIIHKGSSNKRILIWTFQLVTYLTKLLTSKMDRKYNLFFIYRSMFRIIHESLRDLITLEAISIFLV